MPQAGKPSLFSRKDTLLFSSPHNVVLMLTGFQTVGERQDQESIQEARGPSGVPSTLVCIDVDGIWLLFLKQLLNVL